MTALSEAGLETKFCQFDEALVVTEGHRIEGYASLFGACDQGGDVVQAGAYGRSLNALKSAGRSVKMLWQHDPAQPIGIWDEVREDGTGLWVKGRLLDSTQKGREAAALIEAGAIDGLSIGYRTVRATKDGQGRRLLSEVELWEVSLVTFPMLPQARVDAQMATEAKGDILQDLATVFQDARRKLAAR
ncbi:HK97 family phage prohead protease [Rhodophyticola sp. CCM32]|uniref:HK97 family phage prohead protease n=1 Tax=Rhodophyticola sp. CCM32 TaxID=2916397 RepID=UPI00107F25CA|nr:HK97 family phage prohead protease [Rhodophyticola sp. CCM32]QBX99839.1 HK97 family phage prohead protease [Rhodophyticola sp. CCM32]